MDRSEGKLRIPKLIGNGMVLQRRQPIRIWGWSEPGREVTVEFGGKSRSAVSDRDGRWDVTLEAMEAGGPCKMTIRAGESIRLEDILIGDVWVCSGQSNMQTPISRVIDLYEAELADAGNPEIRYLAVPEKYDFHTPQADIAGGRWCSADPKSRMDFSAVAWFFASALYRKYHIPIGIINSSLGGTPIEAWMSRDSLAGFPEHLEELSKFLDDAFVAGILKRDAEASAAWFQQLEQAEEGMGRNGSPWYSGEIDTSKWPSMSIPACWSEKGLKDFYGSIWFRRELELPAEFAGLPARIRIGTIVDSDTTYVNGVVVGGVTYRYPPRKYDIPAGILKAGKNTITVRVVSNSGDGEFIQDKPYRLETGGRIFDLRGEWKYRIGAVLGQPFPLTTPVSYKPAGLFNGMISPLLSYGIRGLLWYQGEANSSRAKEYEGLLANLIADWRKKWGNSKLPFLYVQLPNFNKATEQPGQSDWAELRDVQRRTLSQPDTAMAVTIDVGEWNDIHPLDKKPVGQRLALAARKIAYGEDIVFSGPLYRGMKKEGRRIRIEFTNAGKGLVSRDGGPLKQFAIAGPDRRFVWADAVIEGQSIAVWNETVSDPVAVRYAWADNPEGANLYNGEGLPASPFRTDDWEDGTQGKAE